MLPKIYKTDTEIRKHQINTLKIFNDNVTEVQEGTEYRVLFISGGNELCLHVSLSAEFPNEKPFLRVSPKIVHHWLNSESEVVAAPGLLNFTIHSDLGRVVQAVIREFERNPPPLVSNNNTTPSVSIAFNNMGKISPNYGTGYSNIQNFSPPSYVTQSFPQTFPQLNSLSNNELEILNEDSERREEFLDFLPQIVDMNKQIDEQIQLVEELAQSNIEKKSQLDVIKKEVQLRVDEINKLSDANEQSSQQYQSLSDVYSPRNIKEKLRISAEKSDHQSDEIAKSFLNGDLDVDKFVSVFIQHKTLTQARKTKEEILSQQLDKLEKAGF